VMSNRIFTQRSLGLFNADITKWQEPHAHQKLKSIAYPDHNLVFFNELLDIFFLQLDII